MPVLAAVYTELKRNPGGPLATFAEGGPRHRYDAALRLNRSAANRFDAHFPVNTLFPDPAQPGGLNGVEGLIERVIASLETLAAAQTEQPRAGFMQGFLGRIIAAVTDRVGGVADIRPA